LEKIWNDWKKFAEYAFNKSHATCYSWVAYQTAYLKAHYPSQFMAAIMSRRKNDIKEITKLMDECRAMGIPTLGPDVNESYLKFGSNKKGEIRFGLAAIKGMGESAAQAIIDERDANGPYKSVFDFAQRVNLSAVNRKAFESLALSGGFDSFGIARERYFAMNSKGVMFLDTLVRHGQLYQAAAQEAQNSLFGDLEPIEVTLPAIPEAEGWSTIERLNRERDLVGIYLSAHPLDEYDIVLNNLCNTHCQELDDKEALTKKQEITVGGIVTGVKSKFTKTGKPCGFVTIEDFEGSGELALFGEDWGHWQGMLTEGCSVFIKAKCYKKFETSNYIDFKIQDIQYLQTVKEKSIDKITITIDADKLDETTASDLSTLLRDNPGQTSLFIQIHEPGEHSHVMLRSREVMVNVKRDLTQFIEANEGLSYHIN
jgi:DNA polymerase-3 subunit alpha